MGNTVIALSLLGVAYWLWTRNTTTVVPGGGSGGDGGAGTGAGAGSGSGAGGGAGVDTGGGSGVDTGTAGSGSGSGSGSTYNPQYPTTTSQDVAAQTQGFANAVELIEYNNAVRRGLIPDGVTPAYYRGWLAGDPDKISEATLRASFGGDPVAMGVMSRSYFTLGWDQWNVYMNDQTGIVIPPETMDTIPAQDRWSQVRWGRYKAWLDQVLPGLSGISSLGDLAERLIVARYWS